MAPIKKQLSLSTSALPTNRNFIDFEYPNRKLKKKSKSNQCLQPDKRCMSMPSVTSTTTTTTTTSLVTSQSRLLRTHDKRFHRRFPSVDRNEQILNYYSCALLSDILLQGHLYITENYFAFHSNIFGHKTKLLIPISDVVKVTKERTARIIPNAVGVYTGEGKYIFGSLLSRDATYRLMHQIWMKTADAGLSLPDDTESDNSSPALQNISEDEDSASGISLQVSSDEVTQMITVSQEHPSTYLGSHRSSVVTAVDSGCKNADLSELSSKCQWSPARGYARKMEDIVKNISRMPRTSLLLVMSTMLLLILFLSASILMYRITLVHHRITAAEHYHPEAEERFHQYLELQKEHQITLTEEVTKLTNSLQQRIDQLTQVRKSLEVLLTSSRLCESPAKKQRYWMELLSP
ncbi:GRAM domain-containing protein 2A-like isoform X1 [Centruroides sculpturatus]|uniref:GRAM domain-containing protein 2A-like isoform X1 n=2 Tax=Centruroides sculpturatus TaxID=218467 RepID=UPI000C6DC9ED|nr:GRAM domain-containing protein 2A-like isoform X1 [Centruroides sculpturatus]